MIDICHYDVVRNEKFGRYLISNKDLKCGEMVFTDVPIVVGPKPDTPPLCLGCYCPVENTVCSCCSWPICSTECEKSPYHSPECKIFSEAKVHFQPIEDWTASASQLDCITPLRLLLAKENNSDRWKKEIEVMETHTEERKKRPTWDVDQVNIVNFLVDHCKLGNKFSKELVEQVCGILEVNAVEIPSRGRLSIRAIYPRLAVAAHSCIPNIVHSILQKDYELQVRAAIPIKTGEALHLSYTHVLSPTIIRREHLLQSKFFHCECQRCADPTELDTHSSTLKCNKCDNGVILSTNPLDNDAHWCCSDKVCGFKTSGPAMRTMLAVVLVELEQLDALEPGPSAIELREDTLKKYKSVFHPRHSFFLSIKHTLAQLYGRVEGYTIDELPAVSLERKAEFCRLVLKTLDVISPGDSRMRAETPLSGPQLYGLDYPGYQPWPIILCLLAEIPIQFKLRRKDESKHWKMMKKQKKTFGKRKAIVGMIFYELHAPLMYIARTEFGAGLIDKDKLKEKLQEPLQCLSDAARILRREDPQSPQGIIGNIAYQSWEQLSSSLDSL